MMADNRGWTEPPTRGILTEALDMLRIEQDRQRVFIIEIRQAMQSIHEFPSESIVGDNAVSIPGSAEEYPENPSIMERLKILLKEAKDLNERLDKILTNLTCLI